MWADDSKQSSPILSLWGSQSCPAMGFRHTHFLNIHTPYTHKTMYVYWHARARTHTYTKSSAWSPTTSEDYAIFNSNKRAIKQIKHITQTQGFFFLPFRFLCLEHFQLLIWYEWSFAFFFSFILGLDFICSSHERRWHHGIMWREPIGFFMFVKNYE